MRCRLHPDVKEANLESTEHDISDIAKKSGKKYSRFMHIRLYLFD
jgi:hypothetical protein